MVIRVPQYKQQVGLDIASVPVPQQPQPPASAFGIDQYKALEGLGEVGMKIGQQLAARAVEKQKIEADSMNEQLKTEWLADTQTRLMSNDDEEVEINGQKVTRKYGLLNRKGLDAKETPNEFDKYIIENADKYLTRSLTGEHQSELLEFIESQRSNKREVLLKHAIKEENNYHDNNFKASIAQHKDDAYLADNEKTLRSSIDNVTESRAKYNQFLGVDKKEGERLLQEDVKDIVEKAIDSALVQNITGEKATTILSYAKKDLSKENIDKLEKKIKDQSNKLVKDFKVQNEHTKLINGVELIKAVVLDGKKVDASSISTMLNSGEIDEKLGLSLIKVINTPLKEGDLDDEGVAQFTIDRLNALFDAKDDKQITDVLTTMMQGLGKNQSDLSTMKVIVDTALKHSGITKQEGAWGWIKTSFDAVKNWVSNAGVEQKTAVGVVKSLFANINNGKTPDESAEMAIQEEIKRQSSTDKKEKNLIQKFIDYLGDAIFADEDDMSLMNNVDKEVYSYLVKTGLPINEAAQTSKQAIDSAKQGDLFSDRLIAFSDAVQQIAPSLRFNADKLQASIDKIKEAETFDISQWNPFGASVAEASEGEERKTVDAGEDLPLPQKILSSEIANKITDMVTGGMSLSEAEALRSSTIEDLKELPKDVLLFTKLIFNSVGDEFKKANDFVTDPIGALNKILKGKSDEEIKREINKYKIEREGTLRLLGRIFTPISRVIEGARGAIRTGIETKSLSEMIEGGVKTFLKPEESKTITSLIPFQKWELEGSSTAESVLRLSPRALGEAIETFTIAEMTLGLPSKLKTLKKVYAEKDVSAYFDQFRKNEVLRDNFKEWIASRGGFKKNIIGGDVEQALDDVINYYEVKFRQNPQLMAKVVENQSFGKIFMDKLGDETAQLKFALEKAPLKSNLQAVAEFKLPTMVTASQALKTLVNAGVSKEEIEFSGVEEFLKGKDKVSKQELVEYIDKNKVVVETVVKGGKAEPIAFDGWTEEDIRSHYSDLFGHETTKPIEEVKQSIAEFEREDLNRYEPPTATKYSKYQLPGGENYRETLLKLADVRTGWTAKPTMKMDVGDKSAYDVFNKDGKRVDNNVIALTPAEAIIKAREPRAGSFQSSHWDEPNVLVHHRTNQRTDVQGNIGTFVEEIQSDWHREGKSKGYRGTTKLSPEEINKRILDLEAKGKNATSEEKQEWANLMSIRERKGVPNAPFKQTFHELALKDIIRQAVERGDKFVAFISGDQTADRYDLSKQVDRIEYIEQSNGKYAFNALKDGAVKAGKSDLSIEQIGEYLGKDIQKKIAENYGFPDNAGFKVIEGTDLKVGGEWAKKFYDEILPKAAEKYIKKWGGKIEDIDVGVPLQDEAGTEYGTTTQKGFYLTPQMIKEVKEIGQPLFGNRLAGGIEKLMEERGTAGVEGSEPLPDDMPEKPLIFNELEGGKNAKGTRAEVTKAGEQAQGMEQGTEGQVRLRSNGEEGMASEELIESAKKAIAEGKSAEEFVSSQGSPIYHGTSEKFDKFDLTKTGTVKYSDWGKEGVYFTTRKSSADYYKKEAVKSTDKKANQLYKEYEDKAKEFGTTPMMASINLGYGSEKYNELQKYDEAWRKRLDEINNNDEIGNIIEAYIRPNAKIYRHIMEPGMITDTSLAEYAKAKGYDIVEIVERDPDTKETWVDELIVLNTDIIKTKPQLLSIYEQAKGESVSPPSKPPKEPPVATEGEDWEDEYFEKGEVSKLSKEDKADYDLFMKDYMASEKSLSDVVKKHGGIKPFEGAKELEEYKEIPDYLKNKNGMTLDDMATELSSSGFNFDDGEDLRQALISLRNKPKFVVSDETREFIKQQKENIKKGKEAVLKTGRILSKLIKKSDVKKTIRATTGQVKGGGKDVPEHQALKRSLQRQEQVARKASIKTKRDVKETLKLIERSKTADIQNMGYEEREEINKLQSELKGTRTLAGLRDLYSRIQAIKEKGKEKYKVTLEAKNAKFKLEKDLFLSTIKISEKQRVSLKTEQRSALKGYRASSLRLPRVLDKLDGGQDYKGPWSNIVYNQSNKATNTELREIDRRHDNILNFMKEKGLTIESLSKKHIVDGIEMAIDDILSLYTALQNQEKLMAVIYGNELPIGTILRAVKKLSPEEKSLADKIMQDYEDNWPRLRKSFIDYTDGKYDLGKVSGYTPIRRIMNGYEPAESELAKELLERQGLKKAYTAREFTKERVSIPEEYQIPIRLGEMNIWMEQCAKQEHFITHGSLVKELQRLIGDSDIKDAITNGKGLGIEYYEAVRNGINRIANPSIYKAFTQIEKTARSLRGNAAIAYLGYNMLVMAKQFPSFFLFLEDANPMELLGGLYDTSINHKETVDLMYKLSPQMKHRSIERELEELKRIDISKYNRLINKIGEEGMRGIYLIDRFTVTCGWKAVFDKKVAEGLSEEEAAIEAEKAVLRTQPAAAPKDIADIYASSEFLNWFTQFSNQINNIYNMLTYDIPMKVKEKQYGSALGAAIGIVISQYLIDVISRGRLPNKDETGKAALTSFVNLFPIVGPLLASGLRGYGGDVPALSGIKAGGQAMNYAVKSTENKKKSKEYKKKALGKAVESLAVSRGIPYSQPKRTLKGILDLNSGKTKDLRRLIWSESSLKEKSKSKLKF